MVNKCKLIRVRIFSSYSRAKKPWYVARECMTKKQFNKEIKNWKVKEFKENDSWRIKETKTYSWEKGYINKLHD